MPMMDNSMHPKPGEFEISHGALNSAINMAITMSTDPAIWNPSTTITKVKFFEDTNYSNSIESSESVVELSWTDFNSAKASAADVTGADYTLTRFDNIQSTINNAVDVDGNGSIVIALSSGRYDQSFTIDKSMELWGEAKGLAVSRDGTDSDSKVDEISEVYFDISDGQRMGVGESWINGTVTVASDDVKLDGLRLHNFNGPLKFAGTDIDNFTVQNSYVTGFKGENAFRYNDIDGTKSTGWTIDGNLIGGVSGGVGGSFYLEGVDGADVSDNVFWRPGASHMYLTNVANVNVQNNFFVQGLHADKADHDGLYSSLTAVSSWGYDGFSGGDGYGKEAIAEAPTDKTYYGRNYVSEIKGDADGVTFDGNTAKFNSGGIQFWDEGNTSNTFTDTTITNNVFTAFLNADPEGYLSTVSSRHETGLMGGVMYSVADGSASSGLKIKGNTFEGAINEIANDKDIDSLILVQGEVDMVNISENTLEWNWEGGGSPLVSSESSMTGGTTGAGYNYKVYTQGIHLAGDVNGDNTQYGIALQNNTFNTADAGLYISDAILLDANDYSSINLGTLSSDVNIVDNGSADINTYITSSDFGNYKQAGDEYGAVTASGTVTFSILYSDVDVI